MQHCSRTVHIGLGEFPGFGIRQIFITDAGEVHRLFLCVTESEGFEQLLQRSLHILEFLNGCFVVLGQFSACGYASFEIFAREHERAVDEIAVDSDEFVVVARLEIRPGEVVILGLRCVGGEHIAQYVLFAGEIVQILVEPNRPVAGSGYLVSLKIEELIGGYVIRQVIALRLEHSGEDDAVEDDIVFSDEMDHPCVFLFPPFLPVAVFPGLRLTELNRIGDVSDRSVKPYVEHFSFCSFYRHGYAPVQVTGDGARFESSVEP